MGRGEAVLLTWAIVFVPCVIQSGFHFELISRTNFFVRQVISFGNSVIFPWGDLYSNSHHLAKKTKGSETLSYHKYFNCHCMHEKYLLSTIEGLTKNDPNFAKTAKLKFWPTNILNYQKKSDFCHFRPFLPFSANKNKIPLYI